MNYLEHYGRDIIHNGYHIIPIKPGHKRPSIKAWQSAVSSDEQLDAWLEAGLDNHGVGLLTANTPAVDIDVFDAGVVEKLVDWCETHIGATIQRVGQAPKTLLLFRAEASLPKMTSAAFIDRFGQVNRIEVLGAGQQFVAFAIHPKTGEPYQWLDKSIMDMAYDELPILTKDHIEALFAYFDTIVPASWKLKSHRQTSLLKAPAGPATLENIAPKVDIAREDILTTLKQLGAEDHDEWVMVGMALHHQFDGEKAGFELWDSWSQTAVNYTPGETKKRWASFKVITPGKTPVTFASVLKLAQGTTAGGQAVREAACLKRYVQIRKGNQVADLNDPPSNCVMQFNEFKSVTQHLKFFVDAPTKNNPTRVIAKPLWDFWINHPDIIQVLDEAYHPAKDRIFSDDLGYRYINKFQLPSHPDTGRCDNLRVVMDHFEYLFPIEAEREWFLSWMAFNLQRPELRCLVTPLHVSRAHGTGRGFVTKVLKKLVGEWNYKRANIHQLSQDGPSGSFQNFMKHALICVVDEVKQHEKRFEVNDKIREILTESELNINLKYGAMETMDVFVNFFMMTNSTDAMVIPEEDRRMNIFTGPEEKKDRAYYERLYAWLQTDGVAQLFHWLLRRDLSDFNWTEPMDTPMKRTMMEQTTPRMEMAFRELLANPPSPVLTQDHIKTELAKLSDSEDLFSSIPSSGQLVKLLHKYNLENRRIKREGRSVYIWTLCKGKTLSNDDAREALDNYEK